MAQADWRITTLLVVATALTACSDPHWLGRSEQGMRAAHPPHVADTDRDDLSPFSPPIATGSAIPLFQTDEVLEVELRQGSDAWTLSYVENGIRSEIPINRSALDEGRRCRFPSFRLQIREGAAGTIFENSRNGSFRFVAHCQGKHRVSEDERSNQEVFEKYTLYRTLQAAGFMGFDTRLARITYRDTRGRVQAEAYGFFLESPEDLAARYRVDVIPPGAASEQGARELDPRALITYALAERLVAEPYSKSLPADASLFRNAANQVIPALGSLSRSGLVRDDDDCKGDACDQDGDFLADLMSSGSLPSVTEWQKAVLKQAKRISAARAEVLAVLDRNPLSDTRKFRSRFESFFDALDAFSGAHR
jgi:hypothetical protein